ncbi:unnamed protein product [Caenorhabditis nigoni]
MNDSLSFFGEWYLWKSLITQNLCWFEALIIKTCWGIGSKLFSKDKSYHIVKQTVKKRRPDFRAHLLDLDVT